MNIVKKTSTHNTTRKTGRKIEYIVLHYTAGVTSKAGHAASVANMFATSDREASADFIIDDGTIVQYNGDIENRYTWAVGGAKYKQQQTSLAAACYGKCKNNNSISIEMCSTKANTKTLKVTDDDWALTDAVVANARELVKYLMGLYRIDKDHVIMHHMVSGKWCPQPWCKNEAALANWYTFKNSLSATATASTSTPASTSTSYKVKVTVAALNIRKEAGTDHMITGCIRDKGVYTIVSEKNVSGVLWGKLKSGLGWISLKYTEKI